MPDVSATEYLARLRAGELSASEYKKQCLAAIDNRESDLHAFAALDRGATTSSVPAMRLHGVPIGVKDVIETADLPTTFNSPLYENHRAARDAACISVLRAHGAIILGKTTTVEFASLGQVPPTRNPHNRAHTPGGTSSGSAVAVATGMVPLAIGTQTGGSTIRPAAYCGVAALKPTWGLVPTEGLKPYAPSLDTITAMANSVADLELFLNSFAPLEPAAVVPKNLKIGFYKTAYWDEAQPETREALEQTMDLLRKNGSIVETIDGPTGHERLNEAQDTVMHGEGRVAYLAEYAQWREQLHLALRGEVDNVKDITSAQLAAASDFLAMMRPKMDNIMQRFDAVLTPAVPGEAPIGLASTGSAVFNRLWTGLHAPCITLPHFVGPKGLPVGIQLVARRYRDRHLLAVAKRIERMLAEESD